MKHLVLFVTLFSVVMVSCLKDEVVPQGTFLTGSGVFIVNEGNFMSGNGSLSFFSYDSSAIYNDLFSNVNKRPLGDVPNSMEINGDLAYIVVNNSGRIEVVRKSNLLSEATITNLNSPRNIAFAGSSKAYVTSMYSDSVIVLDLVSNRISGYVNIRRSSESIVIAGEKAFVANWVGGNEVMVIDTRTDMVTDSIEVGVEPESMVLDNNNRLWVLCNGGWMRQNFAELDVINTSTDAIEKKFVFPTKEESPSCLKTDAMGSTIYYLNSGVWKMNVYASSLPSAPFIPQVDHYFYKLGVDPSGEAIFVTDAVDYQQKGYLLIFRSDGALAASLLAGIIPGSMCFKIEYSL